MIYERLNEIRKQMELNGIDTYIIPTDDFHQSEYVCDYFKSREYMSGFTGSAGTLIISMEEACLWTDGRYFLQADEQLSGSEIILMKSGEPGVPTIINYLTEKMTEGSCLGFFGKTMSTYMGEVIEEALNPQHITINYQHDLVDKVWNDRPPIIYHPIFIQKDCYTGRSFINKISDLRREMTATGAEGFVLSSLDDIAWLYNIRGNDILYNPVVLSYSYITSDNAYLFISPEAVSDEQKSYFDDNSITLLPYDDIYDFLINNTTDKKILIDKSKTNYHLFKSIASSATIINKTNPTTKLKSIKNNIEINNLKNCHIKDGVAVTRLLYWLKNKANYNVDTELTVVDKLEKYRSEQADYIEPSFDTISGYGEHGAIIHYEPTAETNAVLKNEGFLLLDSGGQYLDGTTDITRTITLGALTDEQKIHYTTVLRGMIALATAEFIHGCTGENLDILARGPFWKRHLNYNHGTGHGVGFFLNVHEGPHRINYKLTPTSSPIVLDEGMVVTDEPGIYIAGSHGIRIENELICVKSEANEYGQFMRFDTLTLAPIDLDAVLPELMTQEEIDFLNSYHEIVYTTLSPYLNAEEAKWLRSVTAEICK